MFTTDWLCILTSGQTVDGRNVPAAIVEELADSYNSEIYSARINVEHSRFSPKLGSVLALKIVKQGTVTKLYAKLKPNQYLLSLLAAGQKIHTSVEFIRNFAKTGKAYLVGLAVTDDPASLGTTAMHLSTTDQAHQDQEVECYCNTEISISQPKPSIFNKLFNTNEENTMPNDAQIELTKTLISGFKSLEDKLDNISDKLTAKAYEPTEAATSTATKTADTDDQNHLSAIQKSITELRSDIAKLTTALNQTDDTGRTEANGNGTSQIDVF